MKTLEDLLPKFKIGDRVRYERHPQWTRLINPALPPSPGNYVWIEAGTGTIVYLGEIIPQKIHIFSQKLFIKADDENNNHFYTFECYSDQNGIKLVIDVEGFEV